MVVNPVEIFNTLAEFVHRAVIGKPVLGNQCRLLSLVQHQHNQVALPQVTSWSIR